MYEFMKKLILRLLRVPPEPDDPMGDVDSLLVFRASYNFFRYRFYIWMVKNIFGILMATVVGALAAFEVYRSVDTELGETAATMMTLLVVAGVLFYSLCQTLISYIALRLDYELRWYKVSDRSLRIREGVGTVKEMTMTFANIQNIEIMQGPIQRLFGIADLKVETAGGGFQIQPENGENINAPGFHVAYFRGIENAVEIRDIMRSRLEKIRSAGLGADDHAPEEHSHNFADKQVLDLLLAIKDEAHGFHQAAADAVI